MKEYKHEVWRGYVAGVKFGEYQNFGALQPGDRLEIRPEPENEFDPQAIRLDVDRFVAMSSPTGYVHAYKLGYIPKKETEKVRQYLCYPWVKEPKDLVCLITYANYTAKTHMMFEVVILAEKPL